jgi:hypothetical protein
MADILKLAFVFFSHFFLTVIIFLSSSSSSCLTILRLIYKNIFLIFEPPKHGAAILICGKLIFNPCNFGFMSARGLVFVLIGFFTLLINSKNIIEFFGAPQHGVAA